MIIYRLLWSSKGVFLMNDLWPEFNNIDQEENNDSLNIIRDQARALGKKLDNKVKATFRKISYNKTVTGLASALSAMATITASTQPNTEEILEEDLQGKKDVSDLLRNEKYKFEIYNNNYRFRLFLYNYIAIYPNTIIIDENIAKELGEDIKVIINNDQELSNLLQAIFSSQRIRRIINMMIIRSESDASKC